MGLSDNLTRMLGAMVRMLERCETDHEVRCVVLTGAGGAFCAGGDVAVCRDSADGCTAGTEIASSGASWKAADPRSQLVISSISMVGGRW